MAEQLGVDWGKLIVQAFNFLILLWLLRRFAYKPLLRIMDEMVTRRPRVRSTPESMVGITPHLIRRPLPEALHRE